MAGYNSSHLSGIFDKAAKAVQESRKPTVAKIVEAIGYKFTTPYFTNVFQLKVEQMATTQQLTIKANSGDSITVAEEGSGTFRIYFNGERAFTGRTAEGAVDEIGRFYGKHTNTPPAVQSALGCRA